MSKRKNEEEDMSVRKRVRNSSPSSSEISSSDSEYFPTSSEEEEYEPEDDNIYEPLQNIDIIYNETMDETTMNEFNKIKNSIVETEPNILTIIREPLKEKDKTNLVLLYEIYKNLPVLTPEWLMMREKVSKLFKSYKQEYKDYILNNNESVKEKTKKLKIYTSENSIKHKIINLNARESVKKLIYRRYQQLKTTEKFSDDYSKLKKWLNWATEIPHDSLKTFSYDDKQLTDFLIKAKTIMDKELYGMEDVKEQLLIFLNNKLLNPSTKKCSLALMGEPGTGKAAIIRLISSLLDIPFQQISCGGKTNPDFLKGHDYTYVGSMPGEITQALWKMKYKNGIVFFDEYEKISTQLASTLLHITDPSQNMDFIDDYLRFEQDLSHLWFCYAMNSLPKDAALLDRMFVINVKGYNFNDKVAIVMDYLLPKTLKDLNIKEKDIIITKDIAEYFVATKSNDSDKGVRQLSNLIIDLCNKIVFQINHQDKKGTLPFYTSFTFSSFISYPVTVSKKMIDMLQPKNKETNNYNLMYL